jgi:hypothetical protein
MRPGITNALRAVDRPRLEGNRNALWKHVWRAEIVHFSAAGLEGGHRKPAPAVDEGQLLGGGKRRPTFYGPCPSNNRPPDAFEVPSTFCKIRSKHGERPLR